MLVVDPVVISRAAMWNCGIFVGLGQVRSNTLVIRIPFLGCILATNIACPNREGNAFLTSKFTPVVERTAACLYG